MSGKRETERLCQAILGHALCVLSARGPRARGQTRPNNWLAFGGPLLTPGRWTGGWGQWRGWLWIAGFWKVSEVRGCVHGRSSRAGGRSPGSASALPLGETQRRLHLMQEGPPSVHLPQNWRPASGALRWASWARDFTAGRVSVAESPHGRLCREQARLMPLKTLSQDRRSHVVSVSSPALGLGSCAEFLTESGRPCSPRAPLTGTHRALVYLLKIYCEGLLFCFVSLLDTLE